MLQHAAEPFIKIMSRPMSSEVESVDILFASEALGNIERLVAEMFSGDETLVPVRYWTSMGVIEGLKYRSWPSFDIRKFDFRTMKFDGSGWPRSKDGREYLYIQSAGIRYHFSSKVWGLQRSMMDGVLRGIDRSPMTGLDAMSELSRVMERMFEEWGTIMSSSLGIIVERRKVEMKAECCDDMNLWREKEVGLMEAIELLKMPRGLFEERY